MAEGLNRFLGDSPLRVIVKLVIVSIVVGFVMSYFDWTPYEVFDSVRFFFLDLWHTGFDALGAVGDYLVIGAVVVIPAFLIIRLLNFRR